VAWFAEELTVGSWYTSMASDDRGVRGKITCVVFDIDGVLIDTARMVSAGQANVIDILGAESQGRERDILEAWQDLAVTIGGKVSSAFVACLVDECRLRGIEVRREVSVYEAFMDGYWRDVEALPGGAELLRWLKDQRIFTGILSNGKRSAQLRKLELAGLLDWFDEALIEVHEPDSKHAKPDPSKLRELLDKAGVDRVRTVYVGDRVSDVLTARLCGCGSVLLAAGCDHPNVNTALRVARESARDRLLIARPDLTVTSLSVLQQWLMVNQLRDDAAGGLAF
jgi:HAD superfamily hydrolase (TIGR01549 family)